MKKKIIVAVSLLLTIGCIGAIVASATDLGVQEPQGQPLVSDKVYYAYTNSSSSRGAVAFCLDNTFVSYGTSQENLRLCTANTDGTYTTVSQISKEDSSIRFYGRTEYKHETSEDTKNAFGGLSGIGITVDSEKVNAVLKLSGVTLTKGTSYYIYIPENYFADESGVGNVAGYIEIPADEVKCYTGNLCEDIATATEDYYDAALFAVENVNGILF